MLSYKLYNSILIVFTSLMIVSCKQTPIATHLEEADKLIIQFKEQNKIVKTVSTGDKAAIKKMVYALGKDEAKQKDCDINGTMIFFKNDIELQQVHFSSAPNCRFFNYQFQNMNSFSAMTNETANFLQSVKEGLDFY